jgi:hypothetical protein
MNTITGILDAHHAGWLCHDDTRIIQIFHYDVLAVSWDAVSATSSRRSSLADGTYRGYARSLGATVASSPRLTAGRALSRGRGKGPFMVDTT